MQAINRIDQHNLISHGAGLYEMLVGRIEAPSGSLLSEAAQSLRNLSQQIGNKRLAIAFSGGIDSECLLQAALASGVDFFAVTMRFQDNLNEHDIANNSAFCAARGIEHKIIELNTDEFYLSNRHMYYAEKYSCSSPQVATHLWLAEQIIKLNAVPVFSGDCFILGLSWAEIEPVSLQFNKRQGQSFFSIQDLPCVSRPAAHSLCFQRLYQEQASFGICDFWSHSANMIALALRLSGSAAYQSKIMKNKLNPQELPKESYYRGLILLQKQKEIFFEQAGFKPSARQSKYTGFEKLHEREYRLNRKIERDRKVFSAERLIGLIEFNRRYREPMQKAVALTDICMPLLSESIMSFAAGWPGEENLKRESII